MNERPLRLLHEILNAPAQQTPDKTVAIVEGSAYTYADLDRQSARLAHALRQQGLQRGDRVAIYMDNTWPCIVSIFGVMRAAGVFVLINPQTKAEKLHYVLVDCDAVVLLTDSHLASQFNVALSSGVSTLKAVFCSGKPNKSAALSVALLDFTEVLSNTSPLSDPLFVNSLDLCCLIYTSGSTGNPKGVMHTHASTTFVLDSLLEYLQLNSNDVLLNLLPLAFDYGLYQLFMTVRLGGTLVLERSFTYPAQILQRIETLGVTVFPGVPTIYAMLISMHQRAPLCLPSIRRITNTAAALPADWLPALKKIFPNAFIFKMYGLTECKRVCFLEPSQIDNRGRSVGKAIPGTEAFLLSPEGEPVPWGGEGILHVRGRHVMLGYWKQPELSAHMLKPGKLPGEHLLCTHDWFRTDNEGFLYFIGRQDDIIKSRGEKVSPLEIENVLLTIAGVYEAAVFGVPDPTLGEAIHAWISPSEGCDLNEKVLRKACMSALENYMVPGHFEIVPSLPKSANGKIDKKAIKALMHAAHASPLEPDAT